MFIVKHQLYFMYFKHNTFNKLKGNQALNI